MSNFYNEIDPYCAQWLRNLIEAGHIPPGVVDERSIEDIAPSELAGFTQCHFFAGIAGWSLALRSAGVPDDYPIWTGSCPCQPFSAAGKGKGFADERHLWPAFEWLIGQCRPDLILGEQVEGPAGRKWLDLVATDLEGHGYAFGTAVFPAAGVGAPQIRHRTYWVANANSGGRERRGPGEASAGRDSPRLEPERLRDAGGVADAAGGGWSSRVGHAGETWDELHNERRSEAGGLADAHGGDTGAEGLQRGGEHGQQPQDGGSPSGMADADMQRESEELGEAHCGWPSNGPFGNCAPTSTGPVNGFWGIADWLYCRDNKFRPVEPGTFPLATGIPARVGKLRAAGNAICVPQAQAFIEVVTEALHDKQ